MAFTLVFSILPVVIRIAHRKKLLTVPDERSSHSSVIPSLGGIAIFLGTLFSAILLIPADQFADLQYVFGALVIIFMVGAKDDVEPLSPRNKTLGLLLGIGILVFLADVRLGRMYHLFGFNGILPYWLSCVISAFTIFVIINAFNLIDGINGLAASLSCLVCFSFGTWFFISGYHSYAILATALAGSLLAFLKYNITPAKIFMGDAGSLVIGAISSVLAIKFITICADQPVQQTYCFSSPVAIAVSFLIVPLFDTIRVFATRIYRGKSPFQPDRRHIHHLLIGAGRTHMEATTILVLINIGFIALALLLDPLVGLHKVLFIQIVLALLMTFFLHRYVHAPGRQESQKQSI